MLYYSTHRQAPTVGLEEALLRGLAPDGGLYYPTHIPIFKPEVLQALRAVWEATDPQNQSAVLAFLQRVGFELLQRWFGEEIETEALQAIAADAQSFPIPIRAVGGMQVLELFHGPTMAFKDVAARHLARLMGHFLQRRGEQAILLVATSGDTGGAIADGFAGQPNIRVVVLFPKGKVSQLQEEQLTRVAPNVTPIEIEGVFDDCQALVKWAFTAPTLRHLPLTSANSINVARLIPQALYYLYAYLVLDRPDLEVVVPSGNFGNLTAGLFAQAMGVPLARFLAATNANDAAARYHASGQYQPQTTMPTLSTAMDVGNPSNFARVLELFGHEYARFRDVLGAYDVSDAETVTTIRRVYEEHGYLLCPHTAVGWAVAERHGTPGLHPLLVATAAPAKFARELFEATGIHVDNRAAIERLQSRPARKLTLPNDPSALAEVLQRLV